MENSLNKYVKLGLVILLSIGSILFTQEIKLLKNPDSTPITSMTFIGLLVLWLFSIVGILIADLAKRTGVKFIQDFPVLGWVAITSLVACLISDFFVTAISAVDFLSITTPILTYAGISVADRLVDLRKTSWKVAIVAVFVFMGTYVGSALLSQFGLFITGN
jgi:hypothetical protein